ncbi:hydroxyethylthiazole kinase [Propionicicella superfundia]|uniref:hydroxyethylthiazole kinase n=1 Tax=Propionicicella superfundia TaxID=348582 RepID=UPI000415B27D|nr:hydroxyethylthiazole kinase [Propionicicella superfundia]
MTTTTSLSSAALAAALADFRSAQPLVACITNIVVAQWTANVLLASGAAPAMVDNPRESGDFAKVASGILVNLGTPYLEPVEAMRVAVSAAAEADTPWVLDPVAAGGLAWRTGVARELLGLANPAILRGNASEIAGLAGGAGGRGVDSSESSASVVDIARDLARAHRTVVAVSGDVDQLTDGDRLVRIHNGHPVMTRVTGVGCSLGALMAGFAAVTDDRLLAAATATALLTVAAERAVRVAPRPGSFAVALLDELDAVTPADIEAGARLS